MIGDPWAAVINAVFIVALVAASNFVVVQLLRNRITELDAALAAANTRLNTIENEKLANARQQIDATSTKCDGIAARLDSLLSPVGGVDSRFTESGKRLKRLERKAEGFPQQGWNVVVPAMSACFSALQSRLDWHLAWLERVSEVTTLEGVDRLKRFDVELKRPFLPRLAEIDLVRDEKCRKSAARSLADGFGDEDSAERMNQLAGEYPELTSAHNRLLVRLKEEGQRVY